MKIKQSCLYAHQISNLGEENKRLLLNTTSQVFKPPPVTYARIGLVNKNPIAFILLLHLRLRWFVISMEYFCAKIFQN